MSTVPGFSSRSTTQHVTQFPQRDEASMTNDMNEPGFSNSGPVEDAPADVHPDVEIPEEPKPGFSNDKAITDVADVDRPAADVVDEAEPPKASAKRSTVKKD